MKACTLSDDHPWVISLNKKAGLQFVTGRIKVTPIDDRNPGFDPSD